MKLNSSLILSQVSATVNFSPPAAPPLPPPPCKKKGGKRTDSISYVYTHDNRDATENTRSRAHVGVKIVRGTHSRRISRIRQQAAWPALCWIFPTPEQKSQSSTYISPAIKEALHGSATSKVNRSNTFQDSSISHCAHTKYFYPFKI